MSKEAVLALLERAPEDTGFYGQLAQDYPTALKDYDLTPQETTAIGTGDVRWIESHIGTKVDKLINGEGFHTPALTGAVVSHIELIALDWEGQQNLLNKLAIRAAQVRAFLPFGVAGLTGGTL